eukprot:CAMPEP_0181209452 /NCGR_PEP_ID=MMETSP1096-20121128/22677_1 /TAXON_ID=156174 ORGANISM="Chrysochromulina ericina, Strain CCMP281" /NCGR_SAMPLE_ID=MMETSP1096 /ASSEMBLY_ACC=CAM_ASM_000453 /LENGTH=126 /DNA_ID=CAMNT_0023300621 /DNA_START=443 /DNA_END=821 /DNA_ORIENTATION=-
MPELLQDTTSHSTAAAQPLLLESVGETGWRRRLPDVDFFGGPGADLLSPLSELRRLDRALGARGTCSSEASLTPFGRTTPGRALGVGATFGPAAAVAAAATLGGGGFPGINGCNQAGAWAITLGWL